MAGGRGGRGGEVNNLLSRMLSGSLRWNSEMLYEISCKVFGDFRDVDGSVSRLVELNGSAPTSK